MEHEYGLSIGQPVLGPRQLAPVREFEQPGLTHRRILSDPGARSGSSGGTARVEGKGDRCQSSRSRSRKVSTSSRR